MMSLFTMKYNTLYEILSDGGQYVHYEKHF